MPTNEVKWSKGDLGRKTWTCRHREPKKLFAKKRRINKAQGRWACGKLSGSEREPRHRPSNPYVVLSSFSSKKFPKCFRVDMLEVGISLVMREASGSITVKKSEATI